MGYLNQKKSNVGGGGEVAPKQSKSGLGMLLKKFTSGGNSQIGSSANTNQSAPQSVLPKSSFKPDPMHLSDEDWKVQLSSERFNLMRKDRTMEAAHSGAGTRIFEFDPVKEASSVLECAACHSPVLAASEKSAISKSGWVELKISAAFPGRLSEQFVSEDRRLNLNCAVCESFLGMVLRGLIVMNSATLELRKVSQDEMEALRAGRDIAQSAKPIAAASAASRAAEEVDFFGSAVKSSPEPASVAPAPPKPAAPKPAAVTASAADFFSAAPVVSATPPPPAPPPPAPLAPVGSSAPEHAAPADVIELDVTAMAAEQRQNNAADDDFFSSAMGDGNAMSMGAGFSSSAAAQHEPSLDDFYDIGAGPSVAGGAAPNGAGVEIPTGHPMLQLSPEEQQQVQLVYQQNPQQAMLLQTQLLQKKVSEQASAMQAQKQQMMQNRMLQQQGRAQANPHLQHPAAMNQNIPGMVYRQGMMPQGNPGMMPQGNPGMIPQGNPGMMPQGGMMNGGYGGGMMAMKQQEIMHAQAERQRMLQMQMEMQQRSRQEQLMREQREMMERAQMNRAQQAAQAQQMQRIQQMHQMQQAQMQQQMQQQMLYQQQHAQQQQHYPQ